MKTSSKLREVALARAQRAVEEAAQRVCRMVLHASSDPDFSANLAKAQADLKAALAERNRLENA